MARQRPSVNRQDPLEDYSVTPAGASAASPDLRYLTPHFLHRDPYTLPSLRGASLLASTWMPWRFPGKSSSHPFVRHLPPQTSSVKLRGDVHKHVFCITLPRQKVPSSSFSIVRFSSSLLSLAYATALEFLADLGYNGYSCLPESLAQLLDPPKALLPPLTPPEHQQIPPLARLLVKERLQVIGSNSQFQQEQQTSKKPRRRRENRNEHGQRHTPRLLLLVLLLLHAVLGTAQLCHNRGMFILHQQWTRGTGTDASHQQTIISPVGGL